MNGPLPTLDQVTAYDARRRKGIRPRLRWNAWQGEWVCSDRSECFSYGWGMTKEAAYEAWLSKFARCYREQMLR